MSSHLLTLDKVDDVLTSSAEPLRRLTRSIMPNFLILNRVASRSDRCEHAKFYLLLEESKRYYDDAFCKRRKAGALGV